MSDAVRVFVGCAPNHEDAESQAVLEYTLRKYASLPVDIVWMKMTHDPASPWYVGPNGGWNTERWPTPFSGFRWGIPAACGYHGRAVYCDSDVIYRDDIAKLWRTEIEPGRVVVAKGNGSWRLCVSLWDCAAAEKYLPPFAVIMSDPESHKKCSAVFRNPGLIQAFAPGENWNCLDGEDKPLDDPSTKAIHYTAMANQPHLKHALPRLAKAGKRHWFDGKVEPHWRPDLQKLFDDLLVEAEAAGYPVSRYCSDPEFGDFRKRTLVNYQAGPRKS